MTQPCSPARVLTVLLLTGLSASADVRTEAGRILEATGVTGGLIVHVGCGDGTLTGAFGAAPGRVVHGLAKDDQTVQTARKHIESLRLDGRVAVARWSGKHLPYVDNLVTLLVASGEASADLSPDEINRVLRPGGVAYIKKNGVWGKTFEPWPADIDEWTHFLHDPSGNAVARDLKSGPPRHMQWLAAPEWTRNHHKLASVSSVVSTSGRLFYIVDEATSASMAVPGRWSLTARDAFNGVQLWKQPLPTWAFEGRKFRSGPVQLPRLLVAVKDRVYMPLGMNEAVSALDAATGAIVRKYRSTAGAEEIIVHDGVLLVVKGAPLAEQALVQGRRGQQTKEPLRKSILAIRTATGETLWTWTESDGAAIMPLTLAAAGKRVFFQAGSGVVCCALESGAALWQTVKKKIGVGQPKKRKKKNDKKRRRQQAGNRGQGWSTATLLVHDDLVLWADGNRLKALACADGSPRWECPCRAGFRSPVDVLVAGGLVWVGPEYNVGRDLRSGDVKKRLVDLADLRTLGHHHRCYREKATDRYLIGGYRGMEFFDVTGENHSRNNWVRGTCQYGIMPCNGLVYAPPHACGCYMESKLIGFWALAPAGRPTEGEKDVPRLERGPAYGVVPPALVGSGAEDWPTYRGNPLRSGSTRSAVPAALGRKWHVKAGGKITPPIIVGDTVLVAAVDEGRVCALAAGDGSVRWSFTAGGRVDSPPTIHRSLALFGSADGYVYCLRVTDGTLVWRLRAAPRDLRTVAYERVESVWPVHGSVLVLDGVAYVTAGRSSYLDGGMSLLALEPATGNVLHETRVRSAHPRGAEGKEGPAALTKRITQNATDSKTYQAPDLSDAFSMQGGTTSDVLVSDGHSLYLRTRRFDRQCVPQKQGGRHLFSTSRLLDGEENHRSHWAIGIGDFSRVPVAYSWIANRPGGAYGSHVAVPYGLMLTFDESTVWGVRRVNGYTLFADHHTPLTAESKQVPDVRPNEKPGKKPTKPTWQWSSVLDLRPRALIRAGDALIVGGMPALSSNREEGLLRLVSASDATQRAALSLEAPPVWDGLAVAGGRLYVSRTDGVVECLAGP